MGLSVWHQWPRFAWLPDAMDGRDLLMHSIKYGNLNSIPTSLVVSDKRHTETTSAVRFIQVFWSGAGGLT